MKCFLQNSVNGEEKLIKIICKQYNITNNGILHFCMQKAQIYSISVCNTIPSLIYKEGMNWFSVSEQQFYS